MKYAKSIVNLVVVATCVATAISKDHPLPKIAKNGIAKYYDCVYEGN
jgi:hypothetical protein